MGLFCGLLWLSLLASLLRSRGGLCVDMREKFLAFVDWILEALDSLSVPIDALFWACVALLSFMFAALLFVLFVVVIGAAFG